MGRLISRNRVVISTISLIAGLILTGSVGTQERTDKSVGKTPPRLQRVLSEPGYSETAADLLGRRLRYYRKIGDADNAQLVFESLFPEDAAVDSRISLKISGEPSRVLIQNPGEGDKAVPWPPEDVPVLFSVENERSPSIDILRGNIGVPQIFIAAELWLGGGPYVLSLKKSADLGETWTSPLLLGDESPWMSPSLRQVTDDALGVVFTKKWHPGDHDISFARISADLSVEGVFPVEDGLLTQGSPSLASDYGSFPFPYVYVVYAEREASTTRVKFRISRDIGTTWSHPVEIGAFAAPGDLDCQASIAFNPLDSSLTVAYVAWQGGSEGIAVSRSRSFGAGWSAPIFITPADSNPDGFPKIAANGKTVVVAYEHTHTQSDRDIRYAFSTDRGSSWIIGGTLAAGTSDERFPDVRMAEGADSPRIFASYVIDGIRVVARSCENSSPNAWSEEVDLKSDQNVIGSGPVALVPMAGSEEGVAAAATWSEMNPDHDVYFNAEWLRILALAELSVTPDSQAVPYTAGTTSFSVVKTGSGQVSWTAAVTVGGDWLSIQSGGSGTNAGTIVAAYTANAGPTTRAGTITVTPTDAGVPPVEVTVTQAGAPQLSVTPAGGLTSTGEAGGPFTPASLTYTLENTGGTAFDWTATATQTWVTVSATAGTLVPGATAAVTVSINGNANVLTVGSYADTVTFSNATNGIGNATRPVSLTVQPPPGTLSVTPATGLTTTGPVGGPFTPVSVAYTLQNIGTTAVDWTAANSQLWVTLSSTGGTLAPGGTTTVTVSIDSSANALMAGTYDDNVNFTNATNGRGSTSRAVSLTAVPPGVLTVTPATGLTSTGLVGGPFTPASAVYTLQNTGGAPINWTAAKAQTWTTLSAASGTLAAGATATVTVSINTGANALGAGTYNDTVTFTNATNGTGNTTRAVSLTVEPPPGVLSVTPATGLTSTGLVGGPFTPASAVYTLQNTGGVAIDWTAAKTQAWTTLSAVSGTLAAGATTTLTATINTDANALAAGAYSDTVTFTNTTNGTGNTTRAVSLTISLPGTLSVTPATGLTSTGIVGGPFTPASAAYTLQNTGGVAVDWTAAKTQAWTTLSAVSGMLAAGATTTVTLTINTDANALAAGAYSDTVIFTNTTNGTGNTTRPVSLTVSPPPGILSVTPATGLVSAGVVGGPFTPTSAVYTLQNDGGTIINWTAAKAQAWITLSAVSGTLAAGATTTVMLTINTDANALVAGSYADTVTFTNTTNGNGNTTRLVSLTVNPPPGALAVTPATGLVSAGTQGGPFTPASAVYTLQNTGGVAIDWTAAKTQTWTTLSASSGTLSAGTTTTVTVTINTGANELIAGTYTDTVTFTNTTNGSGNTTRPVNLTVNPPPGVLTVMPATGLTSAGYVGGPFTPASAVYTLQNTGGVAIGWTAAKTQTWTTLSAVSGTLAAGATATVTVSINTDANALAAGAYSDTVTFANTTNGAGNTTRPVGLTITLPGSLAVTPATGLTSAGYVGGPFTPASAVYTLQNSGGASINWTAAKVQTWVTLSAVSGTLAAGATTTVTVTINTGANALAAGTYTDTVTFANATNGSGNTTRPVTLTVNPPPGVLTVTPATGLISAGFVGGPFAPDNVVYTLQNTGGVAIDWTLAITQPWVTRSAAAGTLAPGATTTVTVSINATANTLAAGIYTDTVTITNTTNGTGNTTREVNLTITLPGAMGVTPGTTLASTGIVGGPFTPNTLIYTLQNAGGESINWTAAKTQTWVTLSAVSGTLAAGTTTTVTVTINSGANALAAGTYADTVTFTNTTNGNGNTTRAVSLVVNPTPGALTVTPATGLASTGFVGGPFTPNNVVYTLRNTGGVAIDWTLAITQPWVTRSAAAGTLAPGASTTVTISINNNANTLAAGTYTDTVTITNTTNGNGNTTRLVTLTLTVAGALVVTPGTGLASTGIVGGPFTPNNVVYSLQNSGETSINWTAAKTQTWITLSAASGTLAPGATTTVTATINTGANALAAGTYADTLSFTNATNGKGNTTRAVNLVVNPTPGFLAVTPAGGLASTGIVGGPFTPSSIVYTLRNTGGVQLDWTLSIAQPWVTRSGAAGTLLPGESTTVAISINNNANTLTAGTYSDTVIITNTTNGSGNTTRLVSLTVNPPPGVLSVTPATGFASSGTIGGPFSPASTVYTLQNTGGVSLNWTAAKTQPWVTLSAGAGILAPGATTTVTVTINTGANSLAIGTYSDVLTITNITSGSGNTTRAVDLAVNPPPGIMRVTPDGGLSSSGFQGGPFTASSQDYLIENTGGAPINWTAVRSQGWITLSAASGSLNPGAKTTVTVTINDGANYLAVGAYSDTVTFTNATTGSGNTVRQIQLTVIALPTLSVTPASRSVMAAAGTTTFSVANTGGGNFDWTAEVIVGESWLSLQPGSNGTNHGTVSVSFLTNPGVSERQGIIRVTAPGARGNPADVTVVQAAGSLNLALDGERLMEKAWIIQREYGRLNLTVIRAPTVIVDRFVVYRRAGDQSEQKVAELPGSTEQDGHVIYNDTFLDPGTNYIYRILALDSQGNILRESNSIVI